MGSDYSRAWLVLPRFVCIQSTRGINLFVIFEDGIRLRLASNVGLLDFLHAPDVGSKGAAEHSVGRRIINRDDLCYRLWGAEGNRHSRLGAPEQNQPMDMFAAVSYNIHGVAYQDGLF